MTKALSILERFATTAVAAFAGIVMTTLPLTTHDWQAVAWSGLGAAVAAAISLAKNLVLTPADPKNTLERVLWTFLQAAVGALPAVIHFTGHDLKAVLYAAGAAGFAAVVSWAKNVTNLWPAPPVPAPGA